MKTLLKLAVCLLITCVSAEETQLLNPEQNVCENKVNGTLLPYPYNCDWYIRCEDDSFVLKHCEEGRHFNAALQLCDYPEFAKCSEVPHPTTTTAIPPAMEIAPTLNPVDNPCENKTNGTLLPYPYDCDWYIRCEDHNPLVRRCEKERQFNALLQICDYPEIAQCTAIPYPTTTTIQPTGPTLSPGEDVCIGRVNGTLLSYQFDCDWYIRCENEASRLYRCRKLRQFNAFLQVCDYPENANCMATSYSTIESSTTPMTMEPPTSVSNVCCGLENGTLVAYPGDSTRYVQCLYPVPVVLTCDPGFTFNLESKFCESTGIRIKGRQISQAISCKDKVDGTVLPYSEDCRKYYYCSNSEQVLLPCTIGSIFDATIGNCIPGDVCPKAYSM